jgi:acetylglutamate kinase
MDSREKSPETVAQVLMEALPYIQSFYAQTILVKYGGAAMTTPELKEAFIKDVVLMHYVGIRPVVVHGGGPEVSEMMKRLGKEARFVDGLRVTDQETVDIVQMVLKGRVLQDLVATVNAAGGRAVGLSGKDGCLFTIKKLTAPTGKKPEESVDYGFVGEVDSVDPRILEVLESGGFIPVISPLGMDVNGATYNVNADSVAGALAAALKANKLVILTDTPGILRDPKDPDSLIQTLCFGEVAKLLEEGVIAGGMIPKVRACEQALRAGVEKVHIIDGRVPHALLLETFTDQGVGTEIVA